MRGAPIPHEVRWKSWWVVAAMAAGLAGNAALGADWEKFRFDFFNRARNPTETLRPPLDLIWCAPLPGQSGSLTSSPAVVGCALFVVDANGSLHALDANSGSPIWTFAPGMLGTPGFGPDEQGSARKGRSSPDAPVGNDRVYYAVGYKVFGVRRDLADAWTFTGTLGRVVHGFYSSPAVDCSRDELWIGGDGIYKLHASTGTPYINGHYDGLSDGFFLDIWHSSPLLLDEQVVIGAGSLVISVDRCTVRKRWYVNPGGIVMATPAYDPVRQRILFGTLSSAGDGRLYCVDPSGIVVWWADAGNQWAGPVLETDNPDPNSGTAYIQTGGLGGSPTAFGMRAYIVNPAGPTGLPTWTMARLELGFNWESSPSLVGNSVDGVLYAASDISYMVTFRASDGLPAVPADVLGVNGNINAQPTPANGFVYVYDDAGKIVAYSSPGYVPPVVGCSLTQTGMAPCLRPPPPLGAYLSTSSTELCAGSDFLVVLTLTNGGTAQIDNVGVASFAIIGPPPLW